MGSSQIPPTAEDPISQAQQVGFAVTITGVLLWSRLKLQEQQVRKGKLKVTGAIEPFMIIIYVEHFVKRMFSRKSNSSSFSIKNAKKKRRFMSFPLYIFYNII